jgi:hypothetical protein
MLTDVFAKNIGFIIIGAILIYLVCKGLQLQNTVVEGLTGNSDGTDTSTISPTAGIAGTATNYAAAIKANFVKAQDELLIDKYRKDYEQVLINMDDYISMMMLKQILSMNEGGSGEINTKSMERLNLFRQTKETLNTTMKFLDTQ